MYPGIPPKLAPPEGIDIDLSRLWYDVCVEVMDKKFQGRSHGNPRTYDAGCRGPNCAKASRERARRRTSATPVERNKYLDPLIDFFWPIAEYRINEAQSNILRDLCDYAP